MPFVVIIIGVKYTVIINVRLQSNLKCNKMYVIYVIIKEINFKQYFSKYVIHKAFFLLKTVFTRYSRTFI